MIGRSLVDRIGAWSGVVFFVLVFVGNTLATSGGAGNTPTAEQARAELNRQADSALVNIGFTLELLGMVTFLVFVAYLYAVLRGSERGGGWLPVVALTGGITGMAIKLGSADVIGAAFYHRATLSPELARVLTDINGMDFVVSWLPFGVLVAGAGASMLTSRVIGRGGGRRHGDHRAVVTASTAKPDSWSAHSDAAPGHAEEECVPFLL